MKAEKVFKVVRVKFPTGVWFEVVTTLSGETVATNIESESRAEKIKNILNQTVKPLARSKSPGRLARGKGHGFEREVAILLRPKYPDARRKLEYHKDDCKGIDLQGTDPYLFQCKRFKGYAPISAIEEIECNPAFGEVPVLVTAADKKPILAVLPFDEFLRLIQRPG